MAIIPLAVVVPRWMLRVQPLQARKGRNPGRGGVSFPHGAPASTTQIRIPVRKTYTLNIEGKNRDRLLEASKHDIRKYLKRERNKALPAGVDYWDFDTKSGVDEASAVVVPYGDLFRSIDALVADGGDQFYVEVRSKPGHRSVKAPPADVWGKLRGEPADE
jgi:hypothetical protein